MCSSWENWSSNNQNWLPLLASACVVYNLVAIKTVISKPLRYYGKRKSLTWVSSFFSSLMFQNLCQNTLFLSYLHATNVKCSSLQSLFTFLFVKFVKSESKYAKLRSSQWNYSGKKRNGCSESWRWILWLKSLKKYQLQVSSLKRY